ncbi:M61 family metallopeptidase [Phenylobacterium deserti]|uniref:M61 family metallopeptidase n=1 Tax=Phenylobacterium deserti TaxID=1914756 RepID=UPI001F0BBD4F|nr:peptidase M61 [Phenylobacterium deserti]
MKRTLLAFASLLAIAGSAAAQSANTAQPTPLPQPTPAAQDVAFPGVIKLEVDATDLDRRIFRIKETIPVAQAGELVLRYPEWLPGHHAPRGPIDKVAGLVIRANGQVVPWVRDPVDVYAFRVNVPQGASQLDVEFQFLSATAPNQGRVVMTPEMLNLQWVSVALYPAGYYTRRIMVDPSVRLPQGWNYGVALETNAFEGGLATFKRVDFETLMDSPMFAGRYYKQFQLDPPGAANPVRLNVVADSAEELEAKDEHIEAHKNLVRQADRLFGARHYKHYDFLLAITERMGGIGLEHHQSSENGVGEGYFTDWKKAVLDRDLLPHEYTHSWDGKYRRGADLYTPDYDMPMRNSLLWVYEGQTQYWGYVLGARSGMLSKDETMQALAATAATYENRIGRNWRPMVDTTNDPIMSARRPQPWSSWQRAEDYYSEGQLIWLDADTLIRERSSGKRSLDDFARAFFGGPSGDPVVKTYTYEDVVRTLNEVQPYDWDTFLRTRVSDVAVKPPLDGLARGGWKLAYTETPTDYWKSLEASAKNTNLTYSLGAVVNNEGDVTSVQWDRPAFNAGVAVGVKVLAVNGFAYSGERLRKAVTEAKAGKPIQMVLKSGDHIRTVSIDYRGGHRYPRLERIAGTPDRLSQIYAAKK